MLLLKFALLPWRSSPVGHALSSLATGFLLLLMGFLFWIQAGLGPVIARLQGEQVITAYLDTAVDARDEARLLEAVRGALGGSVSTADVRMVGTHELIDTLKTSYPELGRELEDLGPEMESVVPRYVSIAGLLPDDLVDRVRAVQGIESAESSKNRYAQIVGAFVALRWVSRLLLAGMAAALLAGLVQLARMNAHVQKEGLAILRQWGASELEARSPGMLAGAAVGVAGGLLASTAWLTIGEWLGHQIRALSPMLVQMPEASLAMVGGLLLGGAMIGVVSGLFEGRA